MGEGPEPAPAKAAVENQVGLIRERFFTPRLRVKTYDELNAWLTDKCIADAKEHPHPERPEQTVWDVFEEERPKLVPYRGRFDGFHALPASVSKNCLVRFDNNKYSVSASAVGRPVEIHAYADRIIIRQDGRGRGTRPSLWTRRDDLRSVALRPRAGPQAGDCVTARRSKTGCCRPHWSGFDASSPDLMTVIAKWSPFLPPCPRTDCRRSKPPAPWRRLRASTHPM
jgi:Mu transposase, C-terminal domain